MKDKSTQLKKDVVLEKIRNRRKMKLYTQEAMAEKLGISQSAYAKIESGGQSLDLSMFLAIIEILETSVEWMIEDN